MVLFNYFNLSCDHSIDIIQYCQYTWCHFTCMYMYCQFIWIMFYHNLQYLMSVNKLYQLHTVNYIGCQVPATAKDKQKMHILRRMPYIYIYTCTSSPRPPSVRNLNLFLASFILQPARNYNSLKLVFIQLAWEFIQ